jgi:hypothetical protein
VMLMPREGLVKLHQETILRSPFEEVLRFLTHLPPVRLLPAARMHADSVCWIGCGRDRILRVHL